MAVRILEGDCREVLRTLPAASAQMIVTSPPYYGLRDYGCEGQIGLENTPDEYVAALVAVFREARRVLRGDGTLWLNLGDSYTSGNRSEWRAGVSGNKGNLAADGSGRAPTPPGLKPKDLIGIPWRVVFALQADGWWLRQDIIWSKPNPMPESVTDRCTKAHEYLFLLSKSERYHYDGDAIREAAVGTEIGDIDGGPQRLPDGSNANLGRNYRQPHSPQSIASPHGQGFTRRASRSGNKERKPASARGVPVDTGGKTAGAVAGSVPWEGFTRNKRSVWTVATAPYTGPHFATFPPALIEPCILAGCPEGGTVLDPFLGVGTTAIVADRLGRDCIGIELHAEHAETSRKRLIADAGMFAEVAAQ